jgi:YidC/Oxa1 family membrane protein insertase
VRAASGEGLVPGQAAAEALAERAADLPDAGASGQPEPEAIGAEAIGAEAIEATDAKAADTKAADIKFVTVETEELIVELSTLGASVERAHLRKFHSTPKGTEPLRILMPLRAGPGQGAAGADAGRPWGGARSFVMRPVVDVEGRRRGVDLSAVVWKLEEDTAEFDAKGERRVTFAARRSGVEYRKRFVFHREGLAFELEIEAADGGGAQGTVEFDLVGANGIVPDDVAGGRKYAGMLAVLGARIAPEEALETVKVNHKKASSGDLSERGISMALNEWVAVRNRYFAAICQAEDPTLVKAVYAEAVVPQQAYALDRLLAQPNVAGVMRVSLGEVADGASARARFRAYLGPVQSDHLLAAGGERGWEELVSFGWFGSISSLLLGFLKLLHHFTRLFGSILGGYGFAILLLTLAVKAALFPVTRKGMVSMHKMQKLGPQQAAIKKRYAKDKSPEAQRRMQAEIMELYKKHGVSPLGGCLPMLIQIPMFFALFGMLRNAFELRHEPYLWIRDLTQPEHVVHFGSSVPILGDGLNLLPLVYVGLMLLQQHLQPKPADQQSAQQQKMMKYMMLFFPLLLYSMPSGLILYFAFSNAFGILEQWIIRHQLAEEGAPAAGGAALGGAAQEAQRPDARPADGRKTAWDKEDAKKVRHAEKRKKTPERDQRRGPGTGT